MIRQERRKRVREVGFPGTGYKNGQLLQESFWVGWDIDLSTKKRAEGAARRAIAVVGNGIYPSNSSAGAMSDLRLAFRLSTLVAVESIDAPLVSHCGWAPGYRWAQRRRSTPMACRMIAVLVFPVAARRNCQRHRVEAQRTELRAYTGASGSPRRVYADCPGVVGLAIDGRR